MIDYHAAFDAELLPKGAASKQTVDQLKRLEQELHERDEKLSALLADKTTLDSWFKKDDYNQFLLVAKGNTSSMFMNGHLISVFIDNDPSYFRASGKIGLEVVGLGAYYTRNIWLKRM